jgi:hypothetical protein
VRRQDLRVVSARLAQEQLLRALGIEGGPVQPHDHVLDRLERLVAEQALQFAVTQIGHMTHMEDLQPSAHDHVVGAAHGDIGLGYGGGGKGHGEGGNADIQTYQSYRLKFRCAAKP